jgi:hypothetical protein
VPLTSACTLLPVLREVVVPTVAFVARALEVCRVGHMVLAALPRGVGQLGQHHHGCLACALGLGCRSLYRFVALWSYVPCKCPFGNTTVGPDAFVSGPSRPSTTIFRLQLVDEDVLPG